MWPFGNNDSDDSTDERPPKPDDESDGWSRELARYRATVEYRNGEVETFECYGVKERGEAQIVFFTDPTAGISIEGRLRTDFAERSINYETLSREPETEEVATDRLVVTYDVEYEWTYPRNRTGFDKTWVGRKKNVEVDVVKNVGDE